MRTQIKQWLQVARDKLCTPIQARQGRGGNINKLNVKNAGDRDTEVDECPKSVLSYTIVRLM